MQIKNILSVMLISALFAVSSVTAFSNPLIYQQYTADPTAFWNTLNNRMYIYCSHDITGQTSYVINNVYLMSSDDLVNWTDEGVPVAASNTSWAGSTYAPDVIYRNGYYYIYYGNGGGSVGVFRSTSPTGSFNDPLGHALVTSSTAGVAPITYVFDPAAFIDDDGQAYLYFGGGGVGNARVIKLNTDMISVSGSAVSINASRYFEAPFMNKINGTYYFSYSTDFSASPAASIDYLTSSNPMTGFTHRGTILYNPPNNCGNNDHASIVNIGTNYYLAYHNRALAILDGLTCGGNAVYQRSVNLDRLYVNSDGTIAVVTPTTAGVTNLKNQDPYTTLRAVMMAKESGIQTQVCSEGGMNVTGTANGDWIQVRNLDFGSGASGFSARVAGTVSGGSIQIRLDSATGTLVGTCAVPNTGGTQTWQNVSCTISGATALHDIYLVFTGGSGTLFNVESYVFTQSVVSTPTRTQTPTSTSTRTFSPTSTRTNTPTFTLSSTSTRTSTPTMTSTSTPTFTFTSTATRTATPSATPTNTATRTATYTNTPTVTFSSTSSPTATSTRSNTPTSTATESNTPSYSPTRTSTPTSTATTTFTVTRTNTPTSTPTSSSTASFTFSWTSTPTSTYTGMPSATATRSYTPTSTPTQTNTAVPSTSTPTRTPTPTSTSSNTASSTFTATRTNTLTATVTSTATATNTVVPSTTATPTFTSTSVPPTATATATRTSTSTVTETASSTNTMVPSPTATPTLTVMSVPPTATDTWTFTATSTPTMTSTSTLTVTSTDSPVSSATPTLTWTATSSATATHTSTETLTPSGTSTATATFTSTSTLTFTYTLTSTSTFSSTPTMTATWTASSTATSTPSMTATSTPSATFTATPSFTPSVTVTWTVTRTGTATSTVTATFTFTATSTNVPSNCPAVTLSAPYPNPATSPFWPIRFDLRSNCSKTLHWTITTSANRLVVSGTVSVFGRGTLVWDQRDNRGKLVANGLYYFRLLEAGQPDQRARIFILR